MAKIYKLNPKPIPSKESRDKLIADLKAQNYDFEIYDGWIVIRPGKEQ